MTIPKQCKHGQVAMWCDICASMDKPLQKTDVELLSEVTGRTVENLNERLPMEIITPEQALTLLSLKSKQLQATVDELKKRCEELEKYAIHKPNCARLQRPFGASVTVCNDSITCTCGLDKLLTPNERM